MLFGWLDSLVEHLIRVCDSNAWKEIMELVQKKFLPSLLQVLFADNAAQQRSFQTSVQAWKEVRMYTQCFTLPVFFLDPRLSRVGTPVCFKVKFIIPSWVLCRRHFHLFEELLNRGKLRSRQSDNVSLKRLQIPDFPSSARRITVPKRLKDRRYRRFTLCRSSAFLEKFGRDLLPSSPRRRKVCENFWFIDSLPPERCVRKFRCIVPWKFRRIKICDPSF